MQPDHLRHLPDVPGLRELLGRHGGAAFGNGLYRLHHPAHLARWTELTAQEFSRFRSRVTCFGYDWLGRHFALDSDRMESGQPLVLSLEPEIGQAFEIPATFAGFHDVELAEHPDEAIVSEVYAEWRAAAGPSRYRPTSVSASRSRSSSAARRRSTTWR